MGCTLPVSALVDWQLFRTRSSCGLCYLLMRDKSNSRAGHGERFILVRNSIMISVVSIQIAVITRDLETENIPLFILVSR